MNSVTQFQINRYKIIKKVSDDGTRSLFIATDLAANRNVLIKKTLAGNEQYAFFQESFQNEIEVTNFLDHGNILSLIDYGWHNGSFYTVMNYVDGCTLASLIEHPLFDDSIGLMILTLALETLHFCHVKGVSHGDLKPSNLLITTSGQVVLTGFGMSRMITSDNQHRFFSTPLFLPPELIQSVDGTIHFDSSQFENTTLIGCRNAPFLNAHQLSNNGDIAQDIWAAGVLLYRICIGSYPFHSDHFPTLLSSIIQHNPMNHQKFRSQVPKPVISIIGQCLQKNPVHRLNSLDPVLNILHEHFHAQGISFFNEYIAHYLNQKNDLLTFAVTTQETPEINLHSLDHPIEEQQYNKPNSYETKVLRHLVAPNYSLPQISSTPTVKLDPKIIREAFESQNNSKNIFKEIRTLSRVYRVHIVLGAAILAFVTLLVISGSFFIERFGNRGSKQAVLQSTEKKLLRKSPHKKKAVPTGELPGKTSIQVMIPADQSDPVPVQQEPVSRKTPVIAKHQDASTTLSNSKASQPVQQPVTKKSTQLTTSTGSSGVAKKRLTEPVPQYSNQVENSPEQTTGTLKISVDPPQSRVFVDGELLNGDEIATGKELTSGNHTVTADAPEYESYRNTVSIATNESTVLSITLQAAAKGNGQVHVFSYPWANLFVDGELKGTTPTAVPILLIEGTHELSLKRDGYETYTDQITVKTGDVLRLKIDLKKSN